MRKITKMNVLLSSTKIFEAPKTNSVDPDQTALVGAVWSWSTMFASMLMLNRHFQMQLFCWRFRGLIMCWCKMIQLLLNKTTPHFQLLPMSKIDQA